MFNATFDFLMGMTIPLPAMEVILLIVSLSFCLVLRWAKVGLIIAYLLTYRWGWLFFTKQNQEFFVMYLLAGAIVCVLTVIGMIQSSKPKK